MSVSRSRPSAPAASRVPAPPEADGRLSRRFWPILALGLVGVASLLLVVVPMLRFTPPPRGLEALPRPALALLSLVNPVLLVLAGALVGAALAHRVGLRSHVAARVEHGEPLWPRIRAELPAALAVGLALGVGMGVLDRLLRPLLRDFWLLADPRVGPQDVPSLVSGILYGALAEEVQLRWGLLSLLAWLGWQVARRGRGALPAGVAWAAILLAAALVGASQLPAVAAVAPLSGWLVARTLLVSALPAAVLGWLYWRRSLESAMMAHAAATLGLLLVTATR